MTKITLTVAEDGNAVTRDYLYSENMDSQDWEGRIQDMLETLSKANDL